MIVLEWLFLTISACDAAEPWQLGFQDAATPMMQGIIDLHHDIFFFLILILVFVLRILVRALWHFHYKKNPIPQRIVHGTLFQEIFSCMEEAGPSSGASSSNPGNPVVPPIDQGVHGEVSQDEVWDAVDAEERRKEQELRNSKEWKESERHLLKVENRIKSIGQRAKEIAQERGLNPGRWEAVEDAAKYIAEDVADLPKEQQLRFLGHLMRDLNNPNSKSWERIEEEVKRWRSWED